VGATAISRTVHDGGCHCYPHRPQEEVEHAPDPYELKAREWLGGWLKARNIEWDSLTKAQQFLATGAIPCAIRCWRVGVPTGAKPGERCNECGRMQDKRTSWDMIPLPV
jgi:hypothetical protein